jgi:hypothetical protein
MKSLGLVAVGVVLGLGIASAPQSQKQDLRLATAFTDPQQVAMVAYSTAVFRKLQPDDAKYEPYLWDIKYRKDYIVVERWSYDPRTLKVDDVVFDGVSHTYFSRHGVYLKTAPLGNYEDQIKLKAESIRKIDNAIEDCWKR